MDLIKKAKNMMSYKTLPSEFLYTTLQQRYFSLKEKSVIKEKQTFNYESIKDIMTMKDR